MDLGAFKVWLDRQGYSRTTIAQYVRSVAGCSEWLRDRDLELGTCSWRDVRAYASTRPNTYASRSALRSALTAYWRFRRWDDPPAWAVEQPRKPQRGYRGLRSKEDVYRLLEASAGVGAEAHAACCLMYFEALRREETASLRWDRIRHGYVGGIGKGGYEFEQPMHEATMAALERLTPQGPWVFAGRWPGTHVSPATIWMWVRLAAAAAGLGRVTPHQLRHSSAGLMLEEDGNVRTVMTHMRHRNMSSTQIYTRTLEQELRQGKAAL